MAGSIVLDIIKNEDFLKKELEAESAKEKLIAYFMDLNMYYEQTLNICIIDQEANLS